ncbi:hypothetical protein GW17_00021690 [Ensete ventricosum]|nr:hypothetical protein GW17_00021690 [Ensete ventricosum]
MVMIVGRPSSFACQFLMRDLIHSILFYLRAQGESLYHLGHGGVAYPRSGDLVWPASMGGASLFASASFHSSVGSSVVNPCTKAVVGGARCCPDSTPSLFNAFVPQTVKSKCFARCITKPGTSLSGSESSCISRCLDRYIEATGIIGRSLFNSPH